MASTMDQKLLFFKKNGYFVQHDALSDRELHAVLSTLEADGSPTGNDTKLLEATAAVDSLVYHSSVFPFVQRVLGPGARLSGLTYSPRPPNTQLDPPTDQNEGDQLCLARQWHREDSGNVEGACQNDFFAPALQVFFYLDDVDEQSHCTSVIPESADTKHERKHCLLHLHLRYYRTTRTDVSHSTIPSECLHCLHVVPKTRRPLERDGRRHDGLLRIDDYGPYGSVVDEWKTPDGSYLHPTKPTWIDAHGRVCPRRRGGKDIYTRAGGALIINNASFHCLTQRRTDRWRRTVHVRYRLPEPVKSRHGILDPWESVWHLTSALPQRPALQCPSFEPSGREKLAKL